MSALHPNDLRRARACLGLPNPRKTASSNGWTPGPGDLQEWIGMAERGLAVRRPGTARTCGDDTFALTRRAIEGALRPGERLADGVTAADDPPASTSTEVA